MSQKQKQTARLSVAFLFMSLAVAVPAAQQASVELSVKAEKEIPAVDGNGHKALKRIGVAVLDENGNKSDRSIDAAVVPGDEVIYTIHYVNKSKNVATNVVITNPIPEHMNYQQDSAEGVNTSIEFSADGRHFAAPDKLTVPLADGKSRPARAEDYTYVRWTLTAPLAPGKEGHVSYRAVLQ